MRKYRPKRDPTRDAGWEVLRRLSSTALATAVTLAQVAERMPRGVLHPEGAFMRAWAFVLLFFNVWNAFFVPLKICFCAGYSLDGAMAALAAVDYCGDAVFLADVVLCARHVAYHDGEQLVKNPQKIFRRYRRSWRCPAQIFASLPLDVVYFAYPAARHAFNLGRIQYLGLFRLNRLARLFYIGDHFERCERASARWGLKLPKNGTRMARLILAMLAASHVFGSIFFFIADSRGRALGCPEYADPASGKSCKNWAQGKNLLNVRWREIKFDNALHLQNVSSTVFPAWGTKYSKARLPSLGCNGLLWRQYVTSLYWGTATITTVGYGDVSAGSVAESKFSIICLFVSVSLYTLIIANLEDIVSQLDVTLTLNAIQRERVQRYCVRSYLPDSVQRSINDYYDKLWAVQKGVSGTSLLNMLPHNLRAAVVGELAGSMVSGLFFVRDQGAAFVDDLACILDLDLYMPQDFLFRAGECAWNIFLVFFGSVQLLDEASRQVYSVLGRAALGEAEFFGRVLYPLSAEVIDHSQVFALRFSNFEQLLAKWGLVEACRSATIRDYADLQVLALEKLKDTMIPNLRHAKIQRAFAHVIREANPLTERFLVDPNSILKRSWLLLCLAGALYFVISVPFEIAFSRHYKPTIFAGDVFFMAVYVSDIYLNLTRFMVKKQGKLVEDPEHFRELYVRADLANDVLGIFPVSLIAVLAQAGPWGQRFGKQHYSPLFNILRLFQVLRARQLNLYFRSCLAFLGEYCGVQVKGDMVFLVILFCGILTVCHWLASALYTLGRYELYAASGQWGWFTDDSAGCEAYLARRTSSNVWICADSNIYRGRASTRWLYSYYWALYTCSTIGYGAVSIKSNAEKVLCIAAMVVGAICCDAGIVACLTSYFEHRDHQAGTNSRRLNCCAKMLGAAGVPRPLQGRVADFFAYMDDELGNLDEGAVLAELNTALRNAILHRAALTKLCDSLMYGGFEAGIVATMVSEMRTVVCVPLERILQIGQPDPSLFIFQQGVAHSVDGCGDEEPIATGTILSNVEFKQVAKRVGVPTKSLDITVVAARGLPHQVGLARSLVTGAALCNPYVEVVIVSKTVFGSSLKTCSTKVRKHTAAPVFDETFRVKAYQNTEHATVSAYHWRRGLAGKKLGACLVAVKDSANARPRWHALCDDGGRKCGEVRLSCRFDALGRGEIAATAELTVIADSFCHLYKLDFRAQEVVRHYIKGMRLPIAKRLSALHDGAVPFRPSEADLEVMCDGDDEMSLCTHVAGSRGFEAYMSETFSKRSTKGSVFQKDSSLRGENNRPSRIPHRQRRTHAASDKRASLASAVNMARTAGITNRALAAVRAAKVVPLK